MDKATPSSTTFTISEEAFLLSSLSEVSKVWARGSGHTNFVLKIENGVTDLQLNFKLGHPTDAHIQQCEDVVHPPHQSQDIAPGKKKNVWKTPSRNRHERARAAQHQARLQQL